MVVMRHSNLHNHSTFSDGVHTIEQIVSAAELMQMLSIGFSDHSYTSCDPSYCMTVDKYDAYLQTLEQAKRNSSDEILRLISANDKLRVCFDTNHLLGEDNVHFMKAVADKIVTVHISDFDFVNERHWMPGEGKLNWPAIVQAFQDIGYQGVWLYEMGLRLPKTINRFRELTYDDFYRNAQSVFSGQTPEVLSTLKANLGMWE